MNFLYFSWMMIVFLMTGVFTGLFIVYAKKQKLLDIPNDRSSHTKITPRGGGLVFIVIWTLSLLTAAICHHFAWPQILLLIPGTVVVALTGFLDDHFSLKASYRALAYLLAALLVVLSSGGLTQIHINDSMILPLGWLGGILAVFMIVWSTNLFNFMDGIDGIASVEALFTLAFGGYFLWSAGGTDFALFAWLLAAAVSGFFIWNFPPAKLFMGDVGSASLGFVIMVLAILGEKYFNISILLWFILYGVFLVDATLTLLRRIYAKEAWYQPHRSHAYQRLHQLGLSHGNVLTKITLVNLILAMLATIGFYYPQFILMLFLTAMALLLYLYYKIEKLKPMFGSR